MWKKSLEEGWWYANKKWGSNQKFVEERWVSWEEQENQEVMFWWRWLRLSGRELKILKSKTFKLYELLYEYEWKKLWDSKVYGFNIHLGIFCLIFSYFRSWFILLTISYIISLLCIVPVILKGNSMLGLDVCINFRPTERIRKVRMHKYTKIYTIFNHHHHNKNNMWKIHKVL